MSHFPHLQDTLPFHRAQTSIIGSEFFVSSSDFQLRHLSSLVAICILVFEYIRTCRFEFTYIWRRPVTASKVAFVVSRYMEITGKIVHYSLIHTVLGRSPYGVSTTRCAFWYTLLSTQCTVMTVCLDIILFLRVYALHQKQTKSLLFGLPLIFPWTLGTYLNWFWVANRQQSFDGLCNVFFHGTSVVIGTGFITCFIVAHGLLWVSAYAKRNVGQGHVPVVRLVVYEGTWVFVILFAIVTATAPFDIALKLFNPFFHYVCPTTLISILNCRIIQNMHSLAIPAASQQSTLCDEDDFRLTTFISTEDGGPADETS
ncbi:hypothetical protein BJ165DRAFT_1513768 [Panaeolus papilionaceus]|nr:hypothetical protein BJ165DRAFT_1513768 [Panaeolus papilionaceus]